MAEDSEVRPFMVSGCALSLILLGLSGFLLDMHRRSWSASRHDPSLSDGDLRFARSRYRRRTQASGIIGALGIAIAIGPLVPSRPWPFLIYTASLVAGCGCIMLLAAIDAWATRQYYARLRSEHLAAQMRLVQELRRDDG
jgi:hypothetical protein